MKNLKVPQRPKEEVLEPNNMEDLNDEIFTLVRKIGDVDFVKSSYKIDNTHNINDIYEDTVINLKSQILFFQLYEKCQLY